MIDCLFVGLLLFICSSDWDDSACFPCSPQATLTGHSLTRSLEAARSSSKRRVGISRTQTVHIRFESPRASPLLLFCERNEEKQNSQTDWKRKTKKPLISISSSPSSSSLLRFQSCLSLLIRFPVPPKLKKLSFQLMALLDAHSRPIGTYPSAGALNSVCILDTVIMLQIALTPSSANAPWF